MNLDPLLHRYEDEHPARAHGGLYAISGFDFQFREFIAQFAEQIDETQDLALAGETLLEAFSDFIRKDEKNYVCVQAKRTLTKSSIGTAAVEFTLIDRFLESHCTDDERESVHFECLGKFGDESLAWEDVTLPRAELERHDGLQAHWERLRASGRVRGLRVDNDPWWRLVVATFHRLDDPFAFGREALEICLRRGLDPEGALRVRGEITECYRKRQLNVEKRIQALGRADVTSIADRDRDLKVGYTPTLEFLRKGDYMERPKQVAEFCRELEALRSQRNSESDHMLDMFWIDGRSGSGKSVLLLEILRELVSRGESVLWLEGQSGKLQPILDHYRSSLTRTPCPEFIFVDDFYDRQSQLDVDIEGIVGMAHHSPGVKWPIVVTCGPPEFHRALVQRTGAEGIRLRIKRLLPVDQDERQQLKKWFRKRTGRTQETQAAFEQDEGLMISMAFEACHGNLVAFAKRFRERLQFSNLDAILTVPLALNRLYIWTPSSWLSHQDRGQLEVMNDALDFSILNHEVNPAGYLKLTHPHLSDSIYRNVKGGNAPLLFSNDLVQGFTRALNTDLPTARRLLSVFAEGHERLDAVDQKDLAKRCADAWTTWLFQSAAPTPEFLANMWINWSLWAARDSDLPSRLMTDPVEQAIGIWNEAQRGWPKIWSRLSNAYPQDSRLREIGRAWLAKPENFAHPGWPINWQALTDTTATTDVIALGIQWLNRQEGSRAWPFVWQRLLDSEEGLLPEGCNHKRLLRRGWQWISAEKRDERDDWNFVWRKLLDSEVGLLSEGCNHKELLRRGWQWINEEKRDERDDWSHVWRKLLDSEEGLLPAGCNHNELLHRGWQWINVEKRDERKDWTFVWRKLLDSEEGLLPEGCNHKELLRRGWQWTSAEKRDERDDWTFLWRKLLDTEEGLLPDGCNHKELLRRGWQWISAEKRDERDDWTFVWCKLLDSEERLLPEDCNHKELLRGGWQWINVEKRDERDDWTFVWRKLLDSEEELLPEGCNHKRLLRCGWQWISAEKRDERDDWTFVWRKLLDSDEGLLPAGCNHNELLRRGWQWIDAEKRDERDGWSHVWERLLDSEEGLLPEGCSYKELFRCGWQWISAEKRDERDDWTFVWRKLLDSEEGLFPEGCSHKELLRCGWQWINEEKRDERDDWSHIWRKLLDSEVGLLPAGCNHKELLGRGWQWINAEKRDDRDDWTFVWRKLLDSEEGLLPEDCSHKELLRRGWQWLNAEKRDERDDWSHVWEHLFTRGRNSADIPYTPLLCSGFNWLRDFPNAPDWNYVWKKLFGLRIFPEELDWVNLTRLAIDWLPGREEEAQWAYVWEELVKASGLPPCVDREKLVLRGFSWLEGRESRQEWWPVWQHLDEIEELPGSLARSLLWETACERLQNNQVLRGWSFQWCYLLENWTRVFGENRPSEYKRFLDVGAKWLRENESHLHTSIATAKLLSESRFDTDYLDRQQWLLDWFQENCANRINFGPAIRPLLPYLDLSSNPEVAPVVRELLTIVREEATRLDALFGRLVQARDKDLWFEGEILRLKKGGFVVWLDEGSTAFLPGSQLRNIPPSAFVNWVGKRCSFRILEANLEERNAVVSLIPIIAMEEDVQRLQDACDNCEPLAGKIASFNKGGFLIQFADFEDVVVFLPWSQIAGGRPEEPEAWLGRRAQFRILNMNISRRNVVVSMLPPEVGIPEIDQPR